MASYKIDENDILEIGNHLGIALTDIQISRAVELYPSTKAVNSDKSWNEVIEIIIEKIK